MDAGKLFKKGKNLIAVHGHNEYGNQSIDVGFGKVAKFKADKVIQLHTVSQKMAYDKTVLHATFKIKFDKMILYERSNPQASLN